MRATNAQRLGQAARYRHWNPGWPQHRRQGAAPGQRHPQARPPTQELKAYIDQYRDTYGVEPICKVLQIAPSCYWRHAAQMREPALRCDRAKHDDELIPQIQRVWHANWQVYGADNVWTQMNREGIAVARCTVERLMKRLRKLPQIENNMKIEASISLRRRDEEVKVHGEPDCWNLG